MGVHGHTGDDTAHVKVDIECVRVQRGLVAEQRGSGYYTAVWVALELGYLVNHLHDPAARVETAGGGGVAIRVHIADGAYGDTPVQYSQRCAC